MAQEEIYNTRDRSYSAWHRRMSTQRFVGIELAQVLAMIDLDSSLYVEYDDATKEPLALIETAVDVGQLIKPATVTRNLARRCQPTLPALVLLYKLSDNTNPADTRFQDICSFRVKRLWPEQDARWTTCTPQQWANYLVRLRKQSSEQIDQMLNQTRNNAAQGGLTCAYPD